MDTVNSTSGAVAIIHNHPIHYKHLLFNELARLGVKFEVLFSAPSSAVRLEVPQPTEYIARYGSRKTYEETKVAAKVFFVWKALNRLRPTVVIISGYYDAASWTAWFWARCNCVPKIVWAESNRFDHRRYWPVETLKRYFIRNCEAANVYGTTNAEYLQDLGMPPSRIWTKRATVDTELFKLVDRPPKRGSVRVLLFVGRFSQEKNIPFLLRAFAALRDESPTPRLLLRLVGYGPLESHLRTVCAELNLDATVEFRGPLSQKELPAIYHDADALVLPSLHETWGLVVLEAMACGLPVLVSRRCGCAKDVVTAETGWMFSPHKQSELTEAIRALSRTPEGELREMGIRASQLAAQYSPRHAADVVADTITSVLQAASGSARRTGVSQRIH